MLGQTLTIQSKHTNERLKENTPQKSGTFQARRKKPPSLEGGEPHPRNKEISGRGAREIR